MAPLLPPPHQPKIIAEEFTFLFPGDFHLKKKTPPPPATWSAPATFYQRGYTDNPTSTFPPRQNSCRSDMILNLGAIRMKYGTVRRSIQEQSGGAVTATGERQCGFGGERNWC